MHSAPRIRSQGFTLVEMAVVMAIVGLLIGGIMTGQYLIRQAELQSIITDLTKYKAAIVQFREQYGGWPGDLLDAEDYWGTDAVTGGCSAPAPIAADRVPKKATCNGNGNDIITAYTEWFRAWQHMANAGMIDGSFSGVAGAGSAYELVPGENAPAGKIATSTYGIQHIGSYSSDSNAYHYDIPSTVVFLYGGRSSGSWNYRPLLTVREMYAMDQKIDDGYPSKGIFRSTKSGLTPGCTTSDVSTSAAYSMTTKGRVCAIQFSAE